MSYFLIYIWTPEVKQYQIIRFLFDNALSAQKWCKTNGFPLHHIRYLDDTKEYIKGGEDSLNYVLQIGVFTSTQSMSQGRLVPVSATNSNQT